MFKPFYRLYKPYFFLVKIFLLFIIGAQGQQVTWGFNIGSSGMDFSQGSHLDAAGNVYVCGDFRGSNVDFDPSPATALRSSNGQSDAFVAKYSSTGQFLLCITFGGSNLDKINSVSTDPSGNIYITGFFRGSNVDFDPSPATALLSSNGDAGGDPGYGGDVFVAKYSPAGQYIWAFHVGGTLIGDNGIIIKNDAAGNAYVGGYFFESIDFDPSASSAVLNLNDGTGFIAKYNTNGQYQWALNFGEANVSNSMFDLVLDGGANVYAVGYFQGTNIDFDPSPAVAPMSSAGYYDAFVAKYTTNGQYLYSFRMGGTGADVTRGVTIDNAGNFYIVGDFTGTNIDFDPSASTANLSSNGSADVFVAKYTSAGQYVWAFNAGSGGTELGWKIDTDNSSIFVTGGFFGVSDFNPTAAVDNLTSNGGADIFLAKYSLSGVYECGFNIGSSGDDYGADIKVAGSNRFYLCGYFQGNVDFAPTASTYTLNSNGADDVFLLKYYWPPNTLPTGTVTGNTICSSGTGQLTFTATTGTSPFTVSYSDGVNTYIKTNVMSGVPFNVQVNPTATTTYTVTLIVDAVRCSPQNVLPGMATTITVTNPIVRTNNDTLICKGGAVQLNATGAQTYSWSPATALSNPSIANPVSVPNGPIQYIVTGTTASGCIAKDTINISLHPVPVITISNDTLICKNSSVQLSVSGGQTYLWSPGSSLNNSGSATPIASPIANTLYYVSITDIHTCQFTDSVKIDIRPDAIFSVSSPAGICGNGSVRLLASGGNTYQWQPSAGLDLNNISNPLASPAATTTYNVTITENVCNQSQILATTVTVYPLPLVIASKSNDIDCSNDRSQLNATGAAQYSWSPASSLNNPSIFNPVANPATTTDYIVRGVDANGCINTDTVKVSVLAGNKGGYLMPTAFTPNKDGLNDCYRVSHWGIIENIELSIYNRWGQLVFFTKDSNQCWDGTFKGLPQDPGVFVYMVKANTSCEKNIFRKGTFVLIR
ncbi:MAG TPA: gliding motility-associated C-terminal domain-containing protein [Chitinophagaceae bacterium]|jgi:gliding motility-associated-like protein|nr:gliding motility-associated C-terminal domain-containing protein [Chitinophagaceae bacterium]